jgi:hypothetical protein
MSCNLYAFAGVVIVVGEGVVAVTTLAIAIHTFLQSWIENYDGSKMVAWGVVTLSWAYFGIFALVTSAVLTKPDMPYNVPVPLWCWVAPPYLQERLWSLYIWFWITLFTTIITYSLLYLKEVGVVEPHPNRWWWPTWGSHPISTDPEEQKCTACGRGPPGWSSSLFFSYPIAYSVTVLPLSVVRWLSFSGHYVSSAATLVGITLFIGSGFYNTIVYLNTRGLAFVQEHSTTNGVAAGLARLPPGAIRRTAGSSIGE